MMYFSGNTNDSWDFQTSDSLLAAIAYLIKNHLYPTTCQSNIHKAGTDTPQDIAVIESLFSHLAARNLPCNHQLLCSARQA